MLEYYKFKIDRGMLTLAQVPEPYRTQLKTLQAYADQIAAGEITLADVPEPFKTQLVDLGYVTPEA